MALLSEQLEGESVEHDGRIESAPVELMAATNIWEEIAYPAMVSQSDEAAAPQVITKLTHDELEQAFHVEALRKATRTMIESTREVRTAGQTWQRNTTASGSKEYGYSLLSHVSMANGGVADIAYGIVADGEENVTIGFELPDGQAINTKLRLRDRGSLSAQAGGSFLLQINRSGFPDRQARSVTIVGRETPEGQLVGANVTVSSDFKPLSQITPPKRI